WIAGFHDGGWYRFPQPERG
ncbi:MAG: hypothetical protein AVDCRST_MAG43-2083, partial [uncultured Thermomicrobiales bacterium]